MSNEALREGVTRGELPAAPRWMILLPARDRKSGLETAAFSRQSRSPQNSDTMTPQISASRESTMLWFVGLF